MYLFIIYWIKRQLQEEEEEDGTGQIDSRNTCISHFFKLFFNFAALHFYLKWPSNWKAENMKPEFLAYQMGDDKSLLTFAKRNFSVHLLDKPE